MKFQHFKAYKAWRATVTIRKEAYDKRTTGEQKLNKAHEELKIVEKDYDNAMAAEDEAREILSKMRDVVIAEQEDNYNKGINSWKH